MDKKPKMDKKPLPEEVLVQWALDAEDVENEEDNYLLTFQTDEDCLDYSGRRVGVYKLEKVINISKHTTFDRHITE